MRLDQRRVDARAARSSPRWRTPPRRRPRTPTTPARSVSRAASSPRGARLRRREPAALQQRRDLLVDRASRPRRRSRARGARDHQLHQALVAAAASRLVAGDHLDLAAPQAGRDLEPAEAPSRARPRAASRRSRTRAGRTSAPSSARSSVRPAIGLAARARSRPPRRHIGCSSRGGPGRTTTDRRSPGTTRPGRRADRVDHVAPSGTIACLRLARSHRLGVPVPEAPHQRREDLADALLERLVEHQLAAREARHDLDRHVVGGRSRGRRS